MNQAPFSFDLSVMDLYTSLVCGGTLYTMDKKMQSDYSEMLGFLEQSEIEIWVSHRLLQICVWQTKFCGEKIKCLKTFLILWGSAYYSYGGEVKGTFPGGSHYQYLWPDRIYGGSHGCDLTEKLLQETIARGKSLPVGP